MFRTMLWLWGIFIGCTDNSAGDSGGTTYFCESMADAGMFQENVGGGDEASGELFGRLIQDETSHLHDPNMVAEVEYTLDRQDLGGSQTRGRTDERGDLFEVLGAGTWRLQVSAFKGGYICNNSMDFSVVAGHTTEVCMDLQCE